MQSSPLSSQETHSLIIRAQKGDKAAVERLLTIYELKIQQIARSVLSYFIGNEFSDAIQEARIGFWEAVLKYDFDRKTNFEYFARICIKKQLISKVKTAKKCRNKPLNEGESLEAPVNLSDPDGLNEYDLIPDETFNIEKDVINKNEAQWLDQSLKDKLTKLEWDTYVRYNKGYTYREIAAELKRTEKTIDNAIMRVRNKAKEIAEQYINNIIAKEYPDQKINKYYDIEKIKSFFYNNIFN